MDMRLKRKDKTWEAIRAEIARLASGQGRHPRHVGIRVRITKEAVAREAGRSSATLYRFPDMLAEIDAAAGPEQMQRPSASEQHRRKLLATIEDLERRNRQLVGENVRLSRLLAAYDPSLGEKKPTDLDDQRRRRRQSRLSE
jgi:hypothetical protein